jgi:hypothetical protein
VAEFTAVAFIVAPDLRSGPQRLVPLPWVPLPLVLTTRRVITPRLLHNADTIPTHHATRIDSRLIHGSGLDGEAAVGRLFF